MKVTISFQEGERLAARAVEEFVKALWPGVKVHKSDRHPPFKHLYLSIKIPEKPCKSKENN